MKRNLVTIGLILLFIGMFTQGFGREAELVMQKAIAICMECIGIG